MMRAQQELRSKSILAIEDDEGIRETLRFFLEHEGYTVLTADNGKTGLEVLKMNPLPGLILLDLMMPVMNGWEFAEEIQKDPALAAIPILVVSAYANQVRGIKAKGVISKPIDVTKLLEGVRSACGEPT